MDGRLSGERAIPWTVAPAPAATGGCERQGGLPPMAGAGRARVLVLGRMEAYGVTVRQALDALSSHIDMALNEDAARDCLLKGYCDLVLLLLPLAGSDGPALCQRLRAAGGRVPLVVLDVAGTVDDAVACLDAGCDSYLVEPIEAGELRARLAALLRRHGSRGLAPRPAGSPPPARDARSAHEPRIRFAGGIARLLGATRPHGGAGCGTAGDGGTA